MEQTEEQQLHRQALRAHLAEKSAESRDRRRQEQMLIRVFDRHAQSLSRQIAKARHPLPSRRRLRPWVKRLRDLILFPFYTAAWAHGRGKTVSHSSSRTQIKAMDKAVEL